MHTPTTEVNNGFFLAGKEKKRKERETHSLFIRKWNTGSWQGLASKMRLTTVPAIDVDDSLVKPDSMAVTKEEASREPAVVTPSAADEKGGRDDSSEAETKLFLNEQGVLEGLPRDPQSSLERVGDCKLKEGSASQETKQMLQEHTEQRRLVEEKIASLDFQTQRRIEQEKALSDAKKEVIEPLKMIKKGVVATIGGTMVGVGLVMIPLPTPFGAVVASSGLAVLGTEFDGAKELNDKLLDGAKGHLENARDKVVRSIESMDCDSSDDEEEESAKEESEESPQWLRSMNPAERQRQIKVMKEKYRQENQSNLGKMKESMTRSTGSFLSRHLLPLLKTTKEAPTATLEGKPDSLPKSDEQPIPADLYAQVNDIADVAASEISEVDEVEKSFLHLTGADITIEEQSR